MRLTSLPLILVPLLLAACASVTPPPLAAFVVLGPEGAAVARVLTDAPDCPALELDGQLQPMQLRAGPARIALRSTNNPPADSKPAEFPLRSCELALPAATRHASVAGQPLPLPKAAPQRIVVIGDTGCRLLKYSHSYQPCNDVAQFPFATVAARAAAWQPDLVLHVGDYHYRESPCPDGNAGCAGSPWGYGWDAWQADFFAPGAALLRAAPWVMARGNHEACFRAGQGWWRFLDPRPLQPGRDCNADADDARGNYSEPYAVPLGPDTQLLVIDTAATTWRGLQPGTLGYDQYRASYTALAALAARAPHNLGVTHHPLLGLGADRDKQGNTVILKGDLGLQQSWGSLNPQLVPPTIQTMLSGHVHLWQQLSFSSDHPSQFISGFSGTAEDIVPLPLAGCFLNTIAGK
ncbi:MAG: metallophosphoesterase, partial [Sphingomonadaceae bacterium]